MRQIVSTNADDDAMIRTIPPRTVDINHSAVVQSIADLHLWFDADNSPKFQDDTGTTTPVSVSGDPVGYWGDLVGASRAFKQTSTQRPQWIPNVYNGHSCLRYDASNDVLSLAGTAADEVANITVFVVAKATTAGGRVLIAKNHAASGWSSPFARWNMYASGGWETRWNGTNATGAAPTTGSLRVHELVDADMYENGTFVIDGTDADLTYPNANTPLLLGANGISSEVWNGDICEVIIYKRSLTAGERSLVRQSLATKYDLTVV